MENMTIENIKLLIEAGTYKGKIEAVENYAKSENYVSGQTILNILGINTKEESEE